MLCVTHDLALAQDIAEQVIFLDQGVICAQDSVARLARDHASPQVRAFFGRADNL